MGAKRHGGVRDMMPGFRGATVLLRHEERFIEPTT